MKRIILALSILAVASAFVIAQQPIYAPQNLGLSSTYPATVNTNLASPPVLDVRKQHDVAIMITFAHSAASISNVVFHFTPSIDGINYVGVDGFSLTAAATGATPVTISTNWNSKGYGYLRLDGITNIPAILPLTNVNAIYSQKISAP